MVKTYLRYEAGGRFGVVVSNNGNVSSLDESGNYLVVPDLEQVKIISLKRAGEVKVKLYDLDNKSLVSKVLVGGGKDLVVVGYVDGSIRVYKLTTEIQHLLGLQENKRGASIRNDEEKEYIVEPSLLFNGHKSGISSLKVDEENGILYSGSRDTEIIAWDLVGEVGKYRLKGHKEEITGMEIVRIKEDKYLISSSKDTLVKVWDLGSQQCVQTVVTHTSEIWSMSVMSTGGVGQGQGQEQGEEEGQDRYLMVTGTSEPQVLNVFEIKAGYSNSGGEEGLEGEENKKEKWEEEIVKEVGKLQKTSMERTVQVKIDETGKYLGVLNNDKTFELFVYKQNKKKKSKGKGKGKKAGGEQNQQNVKQEIVEFRAVRVVRNESKVKSFDFRGIGTSEARDMETQVERARVVFGMSNNMIKCVAIPTKLSTGEEEKEQEEGMDVKVEIEVSRGGHRTEPRECGAGSVEHKNTAGDKTGGSEWRSVHGVFGRAGGGGGDKQRRCASDRVDEWRGGWRVQTCTPGRSWMYGRIPRRDSYGRRGSRRQASEGMGDARQSAGSYKDAQAGRPGTVNAVTSVDISSDSTLLVSGSVDKNIKIWGLDFGDCHKSIFAHNEPISKVRFIPNTHYIFSCGKDGNIQQYDGDKFQRIITLSVVGSSSCYGMDFDQPYANTLVVSYGDRSIRLFDKTNDLVFIDEEREKEMDALYESELAAQINNDNGNDNNSGAQTGNEATAAVDGVVGQSSLKLYETISEAVVFFDSLANENSLAQFSNNPILIASKCPTPHHYLLKKLVSSLPISTIPQVIMLLPYSQSLILINFIKHVSGSLVSDFGIQNLPLLTRLIIFITKFHFQRLALNDQVKADIQVINTNLKSAINNFKLLVGTNLSNLNTSNKNIVTTKSFY